MLSSPYFLLGAVTWFHTFHEYWACFAALVALSLLARGQTVVAVLLGILSVCIREHFLLALIVISVLAWRSGDLRGRLAVCGGWLLLILVYVVHVRRAMPYTAQGVSEGAAAIWLHWPSLKSALYATMFGSTLYPWPTATVPLLFVSALWGLWRHKSQSISVGLICLIVIPVLAYLVVGPQIQSGGYWGVVYMPWVYLAAPLGTMGRDCDRNRGNPLSRKQRSSRRLSRAHQRIIAGKWRSCTEPDKISLAGQPV